MAAPESSEQTGVAADDNDWPALMRRRFWVVLIFTLLLWPSWLSAAEATTVEELLQSAEQWAKENLDDDALRALEQVDREKVKRLLEEVQKSLQGEYVIDLAALKDTAS